VRGRGRRRRLATLVLSGLALAGSAIPAGAQSLTLSTAAGGASISGANPSWAGGFGTVNGLGIGTPAAGVSVITTDVTGGVLYTTPVDLTISGIPGAADRADVRAHVSTGFANPSVLAVWICYPAASCTSGSAYTAISSLAAAPTQVIPASVGNGTYTASLGLFVSAANGPTAFAGADTATITLRTYRSSNNNLRDTDTLSLNSPNVTVQTALRLLIEAAGGLTISPAPTAAMSFGSVNGLGIGPAPGLTATPLPGGALYATPYALRPTFAGFTSSAGTVRAHVSTDFAHPLILELRESPDNNTFTAISKLAGSPTTINAAASSGSTLVRHLGLFVSAQNGVSAFTGANHATLTFTLVIQ